MSQELTCPLGHRWTAEDDETLVRGGATTVCPLCGSLATPPLPVQGAVPSVDHSSAETLAPPVARSVAPVAAPGYSIEGELGRGGMGVVYKAKQLKAGRSVALKMILSGAHAGADELARFLSEAEAVARLQHANIVQVFEVGEHDGLPFFSMELVSGGSLDRRLRGVPQPPLLAALLAEQLARAVQAAHEAGVIHRDLKPANVLLHGLADAPLEKCVLKITDFGLAKKLDSADGPTHSGDVMGTPSYMAPEQALGKSKEVGPAADVYALGAILYEMLTGRPPFKGASALDTLQQVVTDEPVPPRRLQPKVPRDLETICLKCVHKEAARRYRSAGEMADDLRCFLDGEPILARPVGPLERAAKWARRRPAVAALSAAVVLVAVVGFSLVAWKWRDELEQRRRAESAQEKEEIQRKHAEASQEKEKEARERAERLARDNHDRLVRFYETEGVRLMEDGDLLGSLGWFAAALKEDRGNPQRERIHRTRLAIVSWLCPSLVQTLFPEGRILHAEFSPDGRQVATATAGGPVRVWETATGAPVGPVMQHRGAVYRAAFSPDGRRLVTACVLGQGVAKSEVRLWDVATCKPLAEPVKLPGTLRLAVFNRPGDRVLTATLNGARGSNGEAQLWDGTNLRPIGPPLEHTGWVNHACFSPDGQLVLTATGKGMAQLWRAADGKRAGRTLIHPFLNHASFSPGGRRVVTAGGFSAQVWDVLQSKPLGPALSHGSLVTRAAFSPDGRHVVTASWDMTAQVWVAATGARIGLPLRHKGHVVQAEFSPDGQRVLTVGEDNSARLWNAFTGTEVSPPLKHNGTVSHAELSADGKLLLTASHDETVRIWDVDPERRRLTPKLETPGDGLQGIAITSDGGRLLGKNARLRPIYPAVLAAAPGVGFPANLPWLALASSYQGTMPDRSLYTTTRVWDLTTGKPLTPLMEHPTPVDHGLFSPDGRLVLTVCLPVAGKVALRLHEGETGRLVASLEYPGDVKQAVFSPDGRLLAVGGGDPGGKGAVRIWRTTGKPVGSTLIHLAPVGSLAFSPDGRQIATTAFADTSSPVAVWDVSSGQAVIRLTREWYSADQVSFSPDGGRLLLTSVTGIAQVWDIGKDEPLGPPLKHGAWVTRAAFSPRGKRAVTASLDRTARVWDLAAGKPLTPPLPAAKAIQDASFSPDGRLVATAASDGSARIWDTATGLPVSPPLKHGNMLFVKRAWFSPDGKRLLSSAALTVVEHPANRNIWLWDLSSDNRPANELALRAEWLAGRWLDSTGSYVPLTWSDAIDHYNALVAAQPDHWPLYYRRGRTHAERRQWKEAIDDYTRAIAHGAKVSDVWYYRSKAHGERKQWDQAARDADRAVELAPDDVGAVLQRGVCSRWLGRYEQAVEDFTRFIDRSEGFWGAYGARGSAYAFLGQWDKAEADLEKSFQSKTGVAFTHLYSMLWLGQKDPVGFRKACVRVLDWAGPKPAPEVALWAAWTCVLIPDGCDTARLMALADRAVSGAPKNRDSLIVRGAALYRAGRWRDAIASLTEAHQAPQGEKAPGSIVGRAAPRSFDNTAYELLFLAMAHHRLGESDEARRWLDKAVQWMKQAPLPKTEQGRDNPLYGWNRRLAHETLLREAESLLKETAR
jgi:WD40 repeat protein